MIKPNRKQRLLILHHIAFVGLSPVLCYLASLQPFAGPVLLVGWLGLWLLHMWLASNGFKQDVYQVNHEVFEEKPKHRLALGDDGELVEIVNSEATNGKPKRRATPYSTHK